MIAAALLIGCDGGPLSSGYPRSGPASQRVSSLVHASPHTASHIRSPVQLQGDAAERPRAAHQVVEALDAESPLPESVDELFHELLQVGRRLLQRYGAAPHAHEIAARIQFAVGQLDDARLSWRRVLVIDRHNAWALHGLGLVAARRGDHASALDRQLQALHRAPQLSGAARCAVDAMRRLDETERCLLVLPCHFDAPPVDPNLLLHLGRSLLDAGQPQRGSLATNELRATGKRDQPSEVDVDTAVPDSLNSWAERLAEHYVLAARLHAAHGQCQEAVELCRRAWRMAPRDVASRRMFIQLATRIGRQQEAGRVCDELIAMQPENESWGQLKQSLAASR